MCEIRHYLRKERDERSTPVEVNNLGVRGGTFRRGKVLCQLAEPNRPWSKWVVWSAWIDDDGNVFGTVGGDYYVPDYYGDGSDVADTLKRAHGAFNKRRI